MFAPPGGVGHLRSVLVRHVVALLGVVVVVSLLIVWQSGRVATHDARMATESQVRTVALELSAPLRSLDLDGTEWHARMDQVLQPRVRSGELLEVKIWAPRDGAEGEIIYSTRAEKVGSTSDLGAEHELFGTDDAVVHEVGVDSYPGRDLPAELFEAYVGFADRGGTPYILEVYKPVRDSGEIRGALLRDWLPLTLGGVLLLGLATLPLSLGLSRRVVAVERERRAIAQQALNAAAEEHRRMAELIHDRALQDLAGASLLLGSLQTHDLDEPSRRLVEQVESIVADDITLLRDLLAGPHAVEWSDEPLAEAIAQWCAEVGVTDVEIAVPSELVFGRPQVDLGFRIVKEALRNAAKHALGAPVRVEVVEGAEEIRFTVTDDGPGFVVGEVPDGHFGLRLMAFSAQSMGGSVRVESNPGAGTVVDVALPHDPRAARRRTGRGSATEQ